MSLEGLGKAAAALACQTEGVIWQASWVRPDRQMAGGPQRRADSRPCLVLQRQQRGRACAMAALLGRR